MGYMTLLAECGLCDQTFTASAERVPCFRLDRSQPPMHESRLANVNAPKQPVCRPCFDAINRLRQKLGLPPNVALRGAWDADEIGGGED